MSKQPVAPPTSTDAQTTGGKRTASGGQERIALVFGGRSVEHAVSIASATSIFQALDRDRFEVFLVAIDPQGHWHLGDNDQSLEKAFHGPLLRPRTSPSGAAFEVLQPDGGSTPLEIELAFSIVHGSHGEDGSLQGLFEIAEIPYVGSNVLGSSIQMDKDITKRLLHDASISVAPWFCVQSSEIESAADEISQQASQLKFPVFVKPANAGSSVGITRVTEAEGLTPALHHAARYDTKLLIEQAIDAREIEVAILDGTPATASVPGEIRPQGKFYDYQAKYVKDNTELIVPAVLEAAQVASVQRMALEAFHVLEASGFARVDFLLDRNSNELYVNEVNSLPGFTEISMYPRLWQASGVSYTKLLSKLIDCAMARHRQRAKLETHYEVS